jgi:hypothetical protein
LTSTKKGISPCKLLPLYGGTLSLIERTVIRQLAMTMHLLGKLRKLYLLFGTWIRMNLALKNKFEFYQFSAISDTHIVDDWWGITGILNNIFNTCSNIT